MHMTSMHQQLASYNVDGTPSYTQSERNDIVDRCAEQAHGQVAYLTLHTAELASPAQATDSSSYDKA